MIELLHIDCMEYMSTLPDKAFDFNVDDMNDEEVRQFIERHKKEMPVKIRIEKNTIGWVHVGVDTDSFEMITYFNA